MHGTVVRVEWPTPALARVVLDGDGLAGFTPVPCTDSYVNVAIPPPGAGYAAPFELDDLKGLNSEARPFRRRYTVRTWDPDRRELTVDVIVHGDRGLGGPWAAGAQPGDALVFTGPAGGYLPDSDADWHFMAGDESALPAIAASLEAVPEGSPVFVALVCDGPEFEIPLPTAGRLELTWLHRTGAPEDEDLLADAVRALIFPPGRGHAFVHGEAGEIRPVRRYLLAELGMAPEDLSCSPYWRRGLTDEEWRRIKGAWNAEVERDVVPVGGGDPN